MKPNRLGGQTFEESEIGPIRNILFQADRIASSVPREPALSGHSPIYTSLIKEFGLYAPPYEDLSATIQEVQHVFEGEPEDDGVEASIEQTQLVMACLRWATDNPDQLIRNMTSYEQLEQARGMVAHFIGPTATENA